MVSGLYNTAEQCFRNISGTVSEAADLLMSMEHIFILHDSSMMWQSVNVWFVLNVFEDIFLRVFVSSSYTFLKQSKK